MIMSKNELIKFFLSSHQKKKRKKKEKNTYDSSLYRTKPK